MTAEQRKAIERRWGINLTVVAHVETQAEAEEIAKALWEQWKGTTPEGTWLMPVAEFKQLRLAEAWVSR